MNFRTSIAALFATVAIFFAPFASALSVCVSNTQGLRDQLNAWQILSDQTLTIKLVQGTYVYPYNDYWSQPYYGGNAKLQLLGGYTANCASRSVVATNTTLTGNSVQFSTFQLLGSSSMLVEGITFKSFDRAVSFAGDSSDAGDSIIVRYVIGTDLFGASSSQESFGGFRVLGNSNMRVESSLVYNVHGGDTAAALEVFGFADNAIGIVTNVTAAYNGARGMQLGCFHCSGSVLAYNNILYNNTAGDLDTRLSEAGSGVSMLFSDIDPNKVALGPGSYSPIGNINSDPKFENPLNNDFVLLNASPAINTGAIANGIGIAPTGVAAGNGNAGIGIAAGAHDNVIGTDAAKTPQSSGGGNYIVNNFGPGVWVESTAGAANRIDGNNVIHDNSGFLPVDLGAAGDTFGLGPTGNDADDVDTGPNNLQNYPTLTQAKRIEAKTIVLSGYVLPQASAATQNYRIDLFWTDSCTSTGVDTPRGEMKRYIGFFYLGVATNSHFVPWSNLQLTAPATIPGTGYLFATETNAAGNTSEPGKCFTFSDDYIFANAFGS